MRNLEANWTCRFRMVCADMGRWHRHPKPTQSSAELWHHKTPTYFSSLSATSSPVQQNLCEQYLTSTTLISMQIFSGVGFEPTTFWLRSTTHRDTADTYQLLRTLRQRKYDILITYLKGIIRGIKEEQWRRSTFHPCSIHRRTNTPPLFAHRWLMLERAVQRSGCEVHPSY